LRPWTWVQANDVMGSHFYDPDQPYPSQQTRKPTGTPPKFWPVPVGWSEFF